METWVNLNTGERVQAEQSPGKGWVTLSVAKMRYPDMFEDEERTYKPSASDPYDKTFGSSEARVALLGSAGFQWNQGEGPNALWYTPDGRLVPELTALRMASDPTPPKPSTALTFEEQMRLRQTPSVSVSYSPPDELDLAKEERERRNDDARIQRDIEAGAREDVKLRILAEQNRDAIARGNRAEAREIARDIEATQARRDQAYARVEELNAAAMNRAAEFNASASESAAQRQEQHRQTTLAGQRQNAVDIAGFQQMPGDVGMLGAYLAARQGEGGSPVSTAIGQGENFITDRSLAPLGTLLDTRAELSRPAMFSAARYDPAILAQPQQAPLIQRQPAPATQAEMQERANAIAWANTPQEGAAAPTGFGSIQFDPVTQQWTQNGKVVNAFEAAAAMQSPTPAPASVPTPNGMPQQAPVVQQAAQPLIQRQAASQPMTVTYGAPTQPNPGARMFQRQAAAEGRARSGLEGDLTPIRFSDPGTDPFLAELAGSVTAAERGVDRNLFERERKKLAPRRMPVYGRTR